MNFLKNLFKQSGFKLLLAFDIIWSAFTIHGMLDGDPLAVYFLIGGIVLLLIVITIEWMLSNRRR